MKNKKYKSIFISDVHLGSKDSKASQLNDFLKNYTCESLYLVGDIIDGWKIQSNKWKWNQSHTNVITRILKLSKQGTKVIYVAGNHDEFLRPLLKYNISFGKITIVNQYTHNGVDGKRYLIVHGDLFDGITKLAPWLSFMGDKAYDMLLSFNTQFNWLRHRMGFGYWSISQYLKKKVKKAIDFIFQFEENITNYCIKRKFDGVICGHIHNLELKYINDVLYMNSGDFQETCSAIIETHDGEWLSCKLHHGIWIIEKSLKNHVISNMNIELF